MRILVTGGAGFIGSNFIRLLLDTTPHSIVSLDRLDDAGNLARLAEARATFADRLTIVHHDLRSPINSSVRRALGECCHFVHMAAGSHVDRSVTSPLEYVADNVTATAHLLEYARRAQPRRVLYFSTDEVFGSAPDGVEFDPYGPHWPTNPYAATKAAAEALCPAWAATFGVPLTVTHCTNVYGPWQHEEKFIPMTVLKVLDGQTIQIHAAGQVPSTRCYVHVDDVSRATLTLLERGTVIGGRNTGKYNISGDSELSNLYVAEQIAALLGMPLRYELVDFVPNRPRHDMRYMVSCEHLRQLGWRQEIPFLSGLAETVRHTRERL